MYWPDTQTVADSEPARKPVASTVRKFFTEGGSGVPPTVPGGDWFNQVTNELLNVLAAAGIDPSKTDDDQLLLAIQNVSNAESSYEALRRSYLDAGYLLRPKPESFRVGATITSAFDVVLDPNSGKAYSSDGPYPQTIDPDTDPTSGGFVDRSSYLLRGEIYPVTTDGVLATGKYPVGKTVVLSDRANEKFLVQSGGTPNGRTVLNAGVGKTAALQAAPVMSLASFGYVGAVAGLQDMLQDAADFSVENNSMVILPHDLDAQTLSGIEITNANFIVLPTGRLNGMNTSSTAPRIPRSQLSSVGQYGRGMYQTPADFDIRTGPLVYTSGANARLITDLSRYYPKGWNMSAKQAVANGLTVAHLAEYGSDANSGADFDNALRSLGACLALSPDVIYIDGGHFDISDGWSTVSLAKDISIVNVNSYEKTLFTSRRRVTWTTNGDGTFTSTTLGGTPITAYDRRYLDDYGDMARLEKFADGDTASVIATPFSWCRVGSGAGSVAVINLNGKTPSDYNTWVNRSTNRNINYNSLAFKVYCRGLHWAMGDNSGLTPLNGNGDSVFINEDCVFSHSYLNDGMRVQGVGLTISINSKVMANDKDGFNYHQATNTLGSLIQAHFIEINCSASNHFATPGTANGTTCHDSSRGFRIGGDYGFGIGPSIADVDTAKSYNVCCSGSSGYGDANATGIQAADGAVGMWLHECYASRGRTADLLAKGTATVRVCGGSYGSTLALDSATITNFIPIGPS